VKSRAAYACREIILGSARVPRSRTFLKTVLAGRQNQSARSEPDWRCVRYADKKIANGFSALQILLFREENWRQSRSLHSHSSFCEEVFSRPEPDWRIPESVYSERGPTKLKSGSSVTLANEADRSNILAPGFRSEGFFGLTFFPPSPLVKNCRRHACLCNDWLVGNRIQLQQRNCSGFAPDFSRRPTVSNSQRTKRAIAACASAFKIYLVRRVFRAHFSCAVT
jgi:hypothetical protein